MVDMVVSGVWWLPIDGAAVEAALAELRAAERDFAAVRMVAYAGGDVGDPPAAAALWEEARLRASTAQEVYHVAALARQQALVLVAGPANTPKPHIFVGAREALARKGA